MKNKIAVVGAGIQGRPVIEKLLKKGYTVSTVTRSKEKAEQLLAEGIIPATGSLDDKETLSSVFQQADVAVVMLPVEYAADKVTAFIETIAGAVREHKVGHIIVNTSVRLEDGVSTIIIDSRRSLIQELQTAGAQVTVIEPTIYFENLLNPGTIRENVLAYPILPEHAVAWISAEEVADYVVHAVENRDVQGTTIKLGGPEALTGPQIAAVLSEAMKQPLTYEALPVPVFQQIMTQFFGTENGEAFGQAYNETNRHPGSLTQPGSSPALPIPSIPLHKWAAKQWHN